MINMARSPNNDNNFLPPLLQRQSRLRSNRLYRINLPPPNISIQNLSNSFFPPPEELLPQLMSSSSLMNYDSYSDEDFEELTNKNYRIIINTLNEIPDSDDIKKIRKIFQDNDKLLKIKLEILSECNIKLKVDLLYLQEEVVELRDFKNNYIETVKNLPLSIMSKKIKEDKCCICLEVSTKLDEEYVMTVCNHIFHNNCLKKALSFNQENKKCPLCRKELKNSINKKVLVDITNNDIEII